MRFLFQKAPRCGWLLIAVLLAPVVVSTESQTTPLPSGREVIARYVDAIGGQAALKAVKSIRFRGQFELTGQNLRGDFETVAARPARLSSVATMPGVGRIERTYDGQVGWAIDPFLGPRLIKDRELQEFAAEAEFDNPLHPSEFIKELTTVEKTQYDNRPAYKVHVVHISGVEQMEYFDVETGLQLGWEATRVLGPQSAFPTSEMMRDYKKFGPIMFPTTVVEHALSNEQVLHATSIEYDVVPANAFDMPPQIKALVK